MAIKLFNSRKPERYTAFISYSHADGQHARRLHAWLERFVAPRKLRSRIGGRRRLYPIFRDEAEFSASKDLGELIRLSLNRSDALVVLCSGAAASSRWVEEEVRHFIETKQQAPVICVFVGPSESADLNILLPAPLRRLQPNDPERLAVDMRGSASRKRSQKLRIAAGVLGVGFDELKRRDRRRRAFSGSLIIASTLVVVLLGGYVGTILTMVTFAGVAGGQGMAISDYSAVAEVACERALRIGPSAATLAENGDSEVARLGKLIQLDVSETFSICEHKEMYYFSVPPEDWRVPPWVISEAREQSSHEALP